MRLTETENKIRKWLIAWNRLRLPFPVFLRASLIVSQIWLSYLKLLNIHLYGFLPGGSWNTVLGLFVVTFCGFLFGSLSGVLKLSGVSDTAGYCLHYIVGGLGHVQQSTGRKTKGQWSLLPFFFTVYHTKLNLRVCVLELVHLNLTSRQSRIFCLSQPGLKILSFFSANRPELRNTSYLNLTNTLFKQLLFLSVFYQQTLRTGL